MHTPHTQQQSTARDSMAHLTLLILVSLAASRVVSGRIADIDAYISSVLESQDTPEPAQDYFQYTDLSGALEYQSAAARETWRLVRDFISAQRISYASFTRQHTRPVHADEMFRDDYERELRQLRDTVEDGGQFNVSAHGTACSVLGRMCVSSSGLLEAASSIENNLYRLVVPSAVTVQRVGNRTVYSCVDGDERRELKSSVDLAEENACNQNSWTCELSRGLIHNGPMNVVKKTPLCAWKYFKEEDLENNCRQSEKSGTDLLRASGCNSALLRQAARYMKNDGLSWLTFDYPLTYYSVVSLSTFSRVMKTWNGLIERMLLSQI